MKDARYELIGGLCGEIWICDRRHPDRNPIFRLRPHDERYARRFVNALNTSRPNSHGLTPLQRLLGEVRRVLDLADEELTDREREVLLSITTSLVARLNAQAVEERTG